jgi:hypothetical protein
MPNSVRRALSRCTKPLLRGLPRNAQNKSDCSPRMPMPACEHYPSPKVQLSHAEVSIRSFDQGQILVPVFEPLRHSVNDALTSILDSNAPVR